MNFIGPPIIWRLKVVSIVSFYLIHYYIHISHIFIVVIIYFDHMEAPNIRIDDSRLQTLVYKALSTTERFYDLVMGDKIDKEAADKQLCETLMELGLIVRGMGRETK